MPTKSEKVQKKPIVEKQVFNVVEFCFAHAISRAHFYNLIKEGRGPRTFKAGRRTLISKEAATEWRNQSSAA